MKLLHITTLRMSAITAVVLAFWSVFFYLTIVTEMNDELDDSLEDYAEVIIRRKLRGEPLPTHSSGSNNQYFLRPIGPAEAMTMEHIAYRDTLVYIDEKNEYEPARVISYIFRTEQGGYYKLEVSTPTIDQADLKESIFYSLLILYLILFVSILLINIPAIRYSMRPLHVLLEWLERYQLNKKNEPLHNPTRVDEFERLNSVVSAAMQRNEEVYRQQHLFIGHASHELQTPLAASLNRIEMLLEDDSLGPQQVAELAKIRHTLTGLSKLNRSLLLLTKIENRQYAEHTEVNVGKKTHQLLEDYREVFAHRGICVEVAERQPLVLSINETLATTLLANLLKNAFVHNTDGGSIRIEIEAGGVAFMNTGRETALDDSLIFHPFYHTQGLQSSTGLGLALAKAICEQNALHLSYRFEPPFHRFEVRR